MRKVVTILLGFLLTACAASQDSTYKHYYAKKNLGAQTPQNFQHCHGFGCKYIADVELTDADWQLIQRAFTPAPKNPQAERESIKTAVALFEQKVGNQTGTHVDEWGTFRKTGHYQLDCVDESTNTTIYLDVLSQQGLLRFHNVESPTARFPIIHAGRWPHQTALISEKDSNAFYVVDSWFHDNGHPPEIVGLKQWKEGWKPKRSDDTL